MRKPTQQYLTIKRDDLRFQVRVIKSQHALMTDRQYTRHAVCMAESYGHSVPFWVRCGDNAQAFKLARMAARWAKKVLPE